jgi:hypothetical protein
MPTRPAHRAGASDSREHRRMPAHCIEATFASLRNRNFRRYFAAFISRQAVIRPVMTAVMRRRRREARA